VAVSDHDEVEPSAAKSQTGGEASPAEDDTALRAELRLERTKFHGLANILAQQVWTTTPAGEVDSFNQTLSDYFAGPEELMGLDWVKVIHPDDLASSMAIFGHGLETGTPFQLECRILRHDGQYRWHLSRGIPLRDEDGTILKWLCMVSDLTDTRYAEHLAAIVDSTDDAIVAITLEGTIATLNHGAERLFGVEERDAIDRPFAEVVSLEASVDIAPLIQRVSRARTSHSVDVRTTSRDGASVDVTLTFAPIIGEHGECTGVSAIGRDITERKRMERALAHQALHDNLTGLPNRALFMDRLENALGRARREPGRDLAVLFVDLDNFKLINDSLGHGPGDELLMAVAARMNGALREGDTVARFGGDEFLVLCDGVDTEREVNEIADRLVRDLAQPFEVGESRRTISCSVGIVVAQPDSTAEDLISAADTAMYRAKDAGRGRHVTFDESLRDRVRGRLELDEAMRVALETDGFSLAFQPIMGIAGESLSLEALLRWTRPGHAAVGPSEVIAEAERNGLIVPLGTWVLREACRRAAGWARGIRPVRVSVNLSPRQIDDPGFVETVRTVLAETGLDPALLQLEITEYVLLQGSAAPTLRDLRKLGIGTVLDDFGTGYSSLSYLKLFELDAVKIDKNFVDGLGISGTDTAIVQAVVLIARALGIQVVAEGVEQLDQVRLLADLGCDAIQGYVASRPLPVDGVERLLRRWTPGRGPTGVEALADIDSQPEGEAAPLP